MNHNEKSVSKTPLSRKFDTQKLVVIAVLIILFTVFSLLSPPFRSYSTVITLLSYSYYIAFMAIGVTFALITGGVDLSLGTGMICYGLIGGYLIVEKGMPVGVGMLATVLVAVLFGLFNGTLIAVLDIPPFIATLATMMITRGIGSVVVGGMSVTWPQAASAQGWFRSLFRTEINGILFPTGFIWVLLSVLIMSFILNRTKLGRYIIAIGSNKEATRLSGVKVVKYHIAAYAIAGFFTGLASLAFAATFQELSPGIGGGLELDAIGSAIIGGTSTAGGVGSIVGTLIGVFIMSTLKTGLPYIGLQANWQQIITGIILLGAVGIDVLKNRKH